ncbi:GtrA family protein [Pseudomonas oryzihabitans]|uniref:GtrA family protein n=1 Tax=Pseudomonas oryzihabitans TaxID=47885 RepID=UPI00285786D5|nr:GtrA family protein [Pseudomonas psychrotolerans]MDR6679298.1 putative flippase GtrA [Pseudomonas psychrotolerans]
MSSSGSLAKSAARPLRFALVGAVATLVHMTVAALLLGLWGWPAYGANLGAFLVAFGVSYLGHRHVTFARAGSPWRFLLVALGGFGLNNLLLTGLLACDVPALAALLVATALVPVCSYLLSSWWVFK